MTIAERVYQQTQNLPQSMQLEALHYIEFLTEKLHKQIDQVKSKKAEITDKSSLVADKPTYSKYEAFNFDLERMDKALASGFVDMPDDIDSLEDFDKWIKQVNTNNQTAKGIA